MKKPTNAAPIEALNRPGNGPQTAGRGNTHPDAYKAPQAPKNALYMDNDPTRLIITGTTGTKGEEAMNTTTNAAPIIDAAANAADIAELRKYNRIAEEATAMVETIKDRIKARMNAANVTRYSGTDYKVIWETVTSNRIDTAALKKGAPDVAALYTRPTVSRPFKVL